MGLFHLCEKWGGRYIHPDRLAADLTTAEIDDWITWWDVAGFEPQARDYCAGLIAWAALAGGRGTKSTPEKLMPTWSKEPSTPDDYKARAQARYAKAAASFATKDADHG